jgi:quercetin dioxygenase-like cupin family protein
MGIVATLGLAAAVTTSAHATPPSPPPAFSFEQLGRSLVSEPINTNRKFDDGTKLRLKTNRPIDVAMTRASLAPGATTGWHLHGAVVFLAVTSGTITEYREHNGHCVPTTYTAGQAFVEDGQHAHVVVNESNQPATWVITLLLPKGATNGRIDAARPAACAGIG